MRKELAHGTCARKMRKEDAQRTCTKNLRKELAQARCARNLRKQIASAVAPGLKKSFFLNGLLANWDRLTEKLLIHSVFCENELTIR